MKFVTMKRKKAHLKHDIAKIKHFMDTYFTFELCNCNKCCESRNADRLDELISSLWFPKISERMLVDSASWDNSFILRKLDGLITQFKLSIRTYALSEENTTVCKYCGRVMKIGKQKTLSNVCPDCLIRYCIKCRSCNTWVENDRKNTEGLDSQYCSKCLKTTVLCPCCSARYPKKSMVAIDKFEYLRGQTSTGSVCPNCVSNFIICSDCGMSVINNLIHDYCGGHYCSKCINKHKKLFDWNYIPPYRFVYDKLKENVSKDTLFFGAEIEIERNGNSYAFCGREKLVTQIADMFGNEYIYGKKDGSLCNGFEFVTHPYTWKWYTENKYRFNNLFTSSQLSGFMVSDRCGIHIHLSKKAFTSVHLYKFIDFINKQSNLSFINKIAGRSITNNSYCRPFQENCSVRTLAEIAKKKNNLDFHRYTAVNLTLPNTVELRIFSGTLDPNVFFKYQEFAHSLYVFTLENSIQKNSVKKYRDFIRANKSIYINMLRLIGK